jgi:hypothetical protein
MGVPLDFASTELDVLKSLACQCGRRKTGGNLREVKLE